MQYILIYWLQTNVSLPPKKKIAVNTLTQQKEINMAYKNNKFVCNTPVITGSQQAQRHVTLCAMLLQKHHVANTHNTTKHTCQKARQTNKGSRKRHAEMKSYVTANYMGETQSSKAILLYS